MGPLAIGLSITQNEHPGKLKCLVKGEFDGAWNQGYEKPRRYFAAWQRIVDVLRQEGADNFEAVWQAGASSVNELIDQRHEEVPGRRVCQLDGVLVVHAAKREE